MAGTKKNVKKPSRNISKGSNTKGKRNPKSKHNPKSNGNTKSKRNPKGKSRKSKGVAGKQFTWEKVDMIESLQSKL